MAKLPRVSIGLLMAVVFLVAADFAIVRSLWYTTYVGSAVVTLPMIDLLVLALPRLRAGDPAAGYWYGFEAGGGLMALLIGLLGAISEPVFFWPLEFVDGYLAGMDERTRLASLIVLAILLYTTPQLLGAMLFGRLSARYRVSIERR